MVRIKNAITAYYIGPWDFAAPPTTATLELAKFISNVTPNDNENVEDTGFYDGDGTPEQDVTSFRKGYDFTGLYDQEDPAMAFVRGLELQVGSARKVALRVVQSDGSELFGRATLTAPVTSGGDATEYPDFSCTITYDATPTVTPAPTP